MDMSKAKRPGRQWVLAAILMMVSSAVLVAGQENNATIEEIGVWGEVRKLYELAKETGEKVPSNIYEWMKQDLAKLGTWEYLVVELDASNVSTMEERLNDLGEERWECVWIETSEGGSRLVMKRPSRSYLSRIPVSQLMTLLPLTGADDGP